MAVHDGPGIRTTVFFKGCPLRCRWCHNPEGLNFEKQLMVKGNACTGCGKCRVSCSHPECAPFGRCLHACPQNCLSVAGRDISPEELAAELNSSAEAFGPGFGGFTFSGGEPLMQADFLLETVKLLPGHHICIETSGFAPKEVFHKVISAVDMVLMDVKIADAKLHEAYTGVSNDMILANLKILQNSGKDHIVRTPMIPGVTDTPENLSAIEKLVGSSKWEKIPNNPMAGAKYKMLGMEFQMK